MVALANPQLGVGHGGPTLLDRTLLLAPAPALFVPVQRRRHLPDLTQHGSGTTPGGTWEEEQVFLQVGSQIHERQDLAQAGAADMAQPRRLGVAVDGNGTDQRVDSTG